MARAMIPADSIQTSHYGHIPLRGDASIMAQSILNSEALAELTLQYEQRRASFEAEHPRRRFREPYPESRGSVLSQSQRHVVVVRLEDGYRLWDQSRRHHGLTLLAAYRTLGRSEVPAVVHAESRSDERGTLRAVFRAINREAAVTPEAMVAGMPTIPVGEIWGCEYRVVPLAVGLHSRIVDRPSLLEALDEVLPWLERLRAAAIRHLPTARQRTRHERPLGLDGPRPRRAPEPQSAPAPEPEPTDLWRPGIDRETVMGDVKAEIFASLGDELDRRYALPSSALRRMLQPFDHFLTDMEPDDLVWDLSADQMREVIEHGERAVARLTAIRRAAVAVASGPVLVAVRANGLTSE